MSWPRFRDHRALHIAADRRKPFAIDGRRAPVPAPLTGNQCGLRWLAGVAIGVALTLLCTGAPW